MNYVGVCQATIALFTELDIVIEMISIGTLLVFYLVANALIYRRYVIVAKSPPMYTLLFLFFLSCTSIGFSISWKFKQLWWGLPLCAGSIVTIIALFHYHEVVMSRRDSNNNNNNNNIGQMGEWAVPLMPWPASISIFLNVFLMTTLRRLSYQRFGVWACLITLFYVLYGVHSTYKGDETLEVEGVSDHNSSTQQAKLDIQVI